MTSRSSTATENKNLKSYLKRFNEKAAKFTKIPDEGTLIVLSVDVRLNTTLWRNLRKIYCMNVRDFYQRVKKYMGVDNAHDTMDLSKSEGPLRRKGTRR
ncbi:hypothetical protein PanWU01x14_227370 [Parasponia andersonii]|uniref:Uncharacterized protein n=1 Tax=Parasponia andersonii TaxID=3476 RepID=A0A2P5BM18_PARAD|nr:hypothetical protein PanWU01x14_227370 [Parasponia andersonii]